MVIVQNFLGIFKDTMVLQKVIDIRERERH